MWNDLDIFHSRRDFTNDPVSFPIDEVKAMINNLVRYLFLSFLPIISNSRLTQRLHIINDSFLLLTQLSLTRLTKLTWYVYISTHVCLLD